MRCPNDSSALIVTDHQGVNVHSCPVCRGIWLTPEQLDGIVDGAIASQYANGLGDLDDLEELDDGRGRSRRRDKYSEDVDVFAASRKGKRRRNRREAFDEMLEY